MIGTTNAQGGFVTLGTAQTIAGVKTFVTSPIVLPTIARIKDTGIVNSSTVPSSNRQTLLCFDANNNDVIAGLQNWVYSSGVVNYEMINNATRNSLTPAPTFRCQVNAQGIGSIQAINQRTYSASNTNDVVTIGSLQASTDVVHTTGNETVAGNKTFTGLNTNKKIGYDPTARPTSYQGLYPPILTDSNNNDVIRYRIDRGSTWSGLGWQIYLSNNQGTRKSVILYVKIDHANGNASLLLRDTKDTEHTLASWNDTSLIDN